MLQNYRYIPFHANPLSQFDSLPNIFRSHCVQSSFDVKREGRSDSKEYEGPGPGPGGVHTLFAVDCDFVHAPSGSSGVAIGSGMIGAFSDCGVHDNGGNGITLMTGSALILRGSSVHDNGCASSFVVLHLY